MNAAETEPLFSICIPQFNRTSFLLKSLQRLQEQTEKDFEVCISDAGSTDGREREIIDFITQARLPASYVRQKKLAPYDQNLRAGIAMARGRYCFLLGNDDMLASSETLQEVKNKLAAHGWPEVAITNYHELSSNRDFRRIPRTEILGSGVETAVANFRNYSFVSGVLLDRRLAQDHATDKWDGSEMYQTYLASRIVASGGRLLGIADTVILKDIQIPGEQVDSYARRERDTGPIRERVLPLANLGRVVVDAVAPYANATDSHRVTRNIFRQLVGFTYPPWLVEYRRVQSWRYAAGVALAMRPRNLLKGLDTGWRTRVYLDLLYAAVTAAGLLFPINLFERIKPRLHALAKRR